MIFILMILHAQRIYVHDFIHIWLCSQTKSKWILRLCVGFRQYNQNFHHFSGIHESLYCIIAIGLETIAGLSLPFVKSLNEYYGIQVLTIVQYGVWANARTLITFCIESNEIGKVYASVGIGKEHASKK